jgi:cold shock CspA family protein
VSAWCAGTLKSYDRANGVGLIAPDDGGADVTVSEWMLAQNKLLNDMLRTTDCRTRVDFRCIETSNGRRAVAIKRKENR